MKRVLIFGSDSFTGKHLISYLKKHSYRVDGTSLNPKNNELKCDITKKEEIKEILKTIQPDFIINLSAISFVAHSNNEDFYKINTIGAINILEICQELNINPKKIILASSATIYGNQNKELLDESLCPKPVNHYGCSKLSMEHIASTFFEKLNIIITRPFNYTGIGQSENFLIPKIIKHFKENKKEIELGNLDVIREFNDINFVCEAYKRLLETPHKSVIVNIASNRGIKLLDIIEMMNKIAGYKIKVKINPKFVRKNEIKSLTGSNELLFKLIGKINQKDFFETLKEMYEN